MVADLSPKKSRNGAGVFGRAKSARCQQKREATMMKHDGTADDNAGDEKNKKQKKVSSLCHYCGNPSDSLLRCSKCKVVFYCNQECQTADWKKHHKTFCKQVSQPFLSTTRRKDEEKQTCVIIDGMGPLGKDSPSMHIAREKLLEGGMDVIVIDAKKKRQIPRQVVALLQSKSKSPQALVLLDFGSGGDGSDRDFCGNVHFVSALQTWVRDGGGRCIVQGERLDMHDNWPETWFDLGWKDSCYYRTDFICTAVGPDASHWSAHWYPKARGAITSTYNVKAVMIENVQPQDVLFGTTDESKTYSLVPMNRGLPIGVGHVAVALSRYGRGTVSFFGDVNWEDETMQILAVVARGQ